MPRIPHGRRGAGVSSALVLGALCLLAARASRGQDGPCGGPLSIAEGLERAQSVFVGRVMDVWPARVQSNRQIILGRRIAFQVTARFKGDPGLETLTVMSLCAHSFERDATYLVFAAPDFNGAPTAPEFLPTTNLDRDGLCPEDRQALGAPLAGALDTRSPPAPRDSALHRTARRVAVILLVAEIELREGWRRWNWTEHGDETQFASQLAGAAALGWWMVLLRRRRFALCAWLGLAVPSAVALTFVAWASWRNYPWIADLLR